MPRPIDAAYANHWTSAVGALHGVLRTLGATFSLVEVSALSGHAFRFALTSTPDSSIGADGPACFSSRSALRLYEGLGWRFRAIEAAPEQPGYARTREQALKALRKATERGRPAIVFGLHIPDFGIVRGTEAADGKQVSALVASTTLSPQYGGRIPVAQWPAPGRPQPIRVFVPEKQVRVDPAAAVERMLAFAVEYARRGEPDDAPGCAANAAGLAAFARWAALLDGLEPISPHGQAYCIQALQEARKDAATFLRSRAVGINALSAAAAAYDHVVLELSRMASLFPFPNGGDVFSAGSRRAGALYVRRALAAEEQAVMALESLPRR